MTKAERETSINFNDEDTHAEICTFQKRWLTRLRKNKHAVKIRDIEMNGKIIGAVFHVPKELVTVRNSRRKLTEEQKQKAQARMKERQEKK